MTLKRVKVVMLPTEKATVDRKTQVIWLNEVGQLLHTHSSSNNLQPQHLHILSDEEIKEGDWYYIPRTNSVNQCQNDPTELNLERHFGIRKVIATTDSSLTKEMYCVSSGEYQEPLPQPSQSFIEKYVKEYNKGNIITDVLVEYSPSSITLQTYSNQQIDDNLKALSLKVNPKDNTIIIKKVKDSWNGEEVKQMLADFLTYCWNKDYQFNGLAHDEVANNWFEENL